MKKILTGAIVSAVLLLIVALGNFSFLLNLKIAILYIMGVVANYYQADYSPFKINNDEVDKGTVLHIIWTVYLTQAMALIEAFYFNYPDSMLIGTPTLIFLGISLLGLWLRSVAYITLGKFFTMHLATHSDHKVIEDGPYKFLRHPSYTGAYLTYVFNPLFLKSYYSAAISVLFLGWAFYRRIQHEENMLHQKLGPDYAKFCATRSRLIPGIW